MADISVLSRLISGIQRNVDVSQNTLLVGSLKVGTVTPTELTKTILDNLISLTTGGDAGSLHHHDGRYFTETELGSSSASSGSDLIGDDNTYSNFTPSAATVKGALAGIDTALANTADEKVGITANDTTPGYLAAKIQVDIGSNTTNALEESILNPSGDETFRIRFDQSKVDHGSIAGLGDDDHTQYILAAGTRPFSGNQSMGGFKLTNLAAPTANGDALRYDQLGANNGIATLDAGGKIPVSQLPNSVMEYQGNWNASTNSPSLADGTGSAGDVYRVNVAGTQNLGSGSQTFAIGDWVVYNGTIWEKSINSNSVVSVNGQQGVVSLTTSDINEGSNLYFTDERAQDAIGLMVQNSAKVSLIYVDGTPSLTADIVAGSLVNADISASAAIAYSKLNLSGSIVNADIANAAAIAYSKLNLSNSIVAADLTAQSVTSAKIATSALDQDTITGGNGTALAVAKSPSVEISMVAGEAMAANTSFFVRLAMNGETAGRVYKADKDASVSDKFHVIGVAQPTSALTAGDPVKVVMMGSKSLGASDTSFGASDIGKPVYLTTSGAFSITAPSATNEAVVKVGLVQTTTSMLIVNAQVMGIA